MRKLKVGLGILLAAVMLVGMAGVGWGIPSGLINMQGRLTNNPPAGTDPSPITGPTNCRFSLYTGPTGGSSIWTELQSVTPDSNGVFNVTLGTRYSLDNISVVDDNYYLEIQLEASPGVWQTLDRRQRLVSVPFAITAKNVRGGTVVATTNLEGQRAVSGINTTTTYGYGVYGETSSTGFPALGGVAGVTGNNRGDGAGVFGLSTNGSGIMGTGAAGGVYGSSSAGFGIYGTSGGTATSTDPSLGAGVIGNNTFSGTVPTGRTAAVGIYGKSNYGTAILGQITNTLNFNPAIKGINPYGHGTYGPLGYAAGVYGENTAAAGGGPGVRGVSASGDGVRGETAAAGGIVSGGSGVIGKSTAASSGGAGVKGTSVSGIGVMGSSGSATLPGIQGENNSGGPAIKGTANGLKGGSDLELGAGVFGRNTSTSNNAGSGVYGEANGRFSWGVSGRTTHTTDGSGVWGISQYGGASGGLGVLGVPGLGTGKGVGVYGKANVSGAHAIHGLSVFRDGVSFAGYFDGDVYISRNLSKASGSFLIDHPLDPKNKILRHSFIESPDMKNIYDGIAVMDEKGETVVNLPDYFEALNKDFRYQLTSIGVPSPGIYVKEEISGNKFKIAGGKAGQKISWMVTGIRHDAYAQKYPIVVEEEKKATGTFKKGEYLNADAFDAQLRASGLELTR